MDIDIVEALYESNLYEDRLKDLKVNKFILNHYQLKMSGVAYYVLNDEDLKHLEYCQEKEVLILLIY